MSQDSLRLSSTNTFQAPVKVYVRSICAAEAFSLFNQGLLASCHWLLGWHGWIATLTTELTGHGRSEGEDSTIGPECHCVVPAASKNSVI